MSDTATRQALLNEVATNSIPDHAITSQNSHEDSTARSKRRIMSRLDVFLVHEPGKTVTVPCKESDTIEVVLKWIRNKLGINLDDLYRDDLYVNGRLIQSKDKTIGDSRIFGHVLTYHRLIKNPSVIYIVLPSGKVLEVACRLDMKAVYFRYAIEEKIFSRPDRTRLIYNGKRFEGEITLAEFGIQYGSTVYLLFMQGGEQTAENMITFQSILDAPGARPGELTPTLGTFYTKGKYIESHCPCSPGKNLFSFDVVPFTNGFGVLASRMSPSPSGVNAASGSDDNGTSKWHLLQPSGTSGVWGSEKLPNVLVASPPSTLVLKPNNAE
ncbi:MAG: hypothetical protein JOS17DRAFT_800378 [Linnemannia elongata]|nr:MAG: hypothetical protein JOS17DRAFT_800378 [Linnemannia elongata]